MFKMAGSTVALIFFVLVVLTGRAHPPVSAPDKAAPPSSSDVASGAATGPSEADLVNRGGASNAGSSGVVVLERAPDGHFYADAEVNGVTVHFMVDTGATSVALSPRDAAAVGLDQDEAGYTEVGRGVGGNVAMKPVTLDRLSVGSIASRDVPAMIVQTDMEISLLGQTWLSRVGSVTIEGNRMTLR
jgi:aspartyl protease family protein